jgi:alpha-glucuronidase
LRITRFIVTAVTGLFTEVLTAAINWHRRSEMDARGIISLSRTGYEGRGMVFKQCDSNGVLYRSSDGLRTINPIKISAVFLHSVLVKKRPGKIIRRFMLTAQ